MNYLQAISVFFVVLSVTCVVTDAQSVDNTNSDETLLDNDNSTGKSAFSIERFRQHQ